MYPESKSSDSSREIQYYKQCCERMDSMKMCGDSAVLSLPISCTLSILKDSITQARLRRICDVYFMMAKESKIFKCSDAFQRMTRDAQTKDRL